MENISKTNTEFMIIPDAASNDKENINKLYAMGIDVLIIDHHEIDEYPEQGILINNQLESNKNTNKNLVGAGCGI